MTTRTSLTLVDLRVGNIERQAEWPGAGAVDLAFRGLELAGEVGEVEDAVVDLLALTSASGRLINLLKKTVRIRRGISGTKEPPAELYQQVKDEIGDVLVCLDLLCMDLDIDLGAATAAKFNKTSEKHGLKTRI